MFSLSCVTKLSRLSLSLESLDGASLFLEEIRSEGIDAVAHCFHIDVPIGSI